MDPHMTVEEGKIALFTDNRPALEVRSQRLDAVLGRVPESRRVVEGRHYLVLNLKEWIEALWHTAPPVEDR